MIDNNAAAALNGIKKDSQDMLKIAI